MNFEKLFETQSELDKKIVKEKGLQGEDLLDKKILALQVELGELANEWRGFKFWSEDQKPRTTDFDWVECKWCNGTGTYRDHPDDTGYGCPDCRGEGGNPKEKNPLLEEYVDCLHFTLSIGNDCQFEDGNFYTSHTNNLVEQFHAIFFAIGTLYQYRTKASYETTLRYFLGLGEMLGFTWEQIKQAYFEKNEINHKRQAEGY